MNKRTNKKETAEYYERTNDSSHVQIDFSDSGIKKGDKHCHSSVLLVWR